jgi:hypothetical protein
MMNKLSQKKVLMVLLGIIGALLIVARTELMAPVMRFILNTSQGTPLQLVGCVIAAVIALRLVFVLLNMIGKYYAGELDRIEEERISTQGGKHP